jgi:hypothetical protein
MRTTHPSVAPAARNELEQSFATASLKPMLRPSPVTRNCHGMRVAP